MSLEPCERLKDERLILAGVVLSANSPNASTKPIKTATILEVNSETDFVTKGDVFIGFVDALGELALKLLPLKLHLQFLLRRSQYNKLKNQLPQTQSPESV